MGLHLIPPKSFTIYGFLDLISLAPFAVRKYEQASQRARAALPTSTSLLLLGALKVRKMMQKLTIRLRFPPSCTLHCINWLWGKFFLFSFKKTVFCMRCSKGSLCPRHSRGKRAIIMFLFCYSIAFPAPTWLPIFLTAPKCFLRHTWDLSLGVGGIALNDAVSNPGASVPDVLTSDVKMADDSFPARMGEIGLYRPRWGLICRCVIAAVSFDKICRELGSLNPRCMNIVCMYALSSTQPKERGDFMDDGVSGGSILGQGGREGGLFVLWTCERRAEMTSLGCCAFYRPRPPQVQIVRTMSRLNKVLRFYARVGKGTEGNENTP